MPQDIKTFLDFLAGMPPYWWFGIALGEVAILFLVLGFLQGLLTRRLGDMLPLILAVLIAAAVSYGFYVKYVEPMGSGNVQIQSVG